MDVETTISKIDLAGQVSFEEAAFLLLYKHIPKRAELIAFSTRLAKARALPLQIAELIKTLRHARPITVLRTAVSALGAVQEQQADRASRIDPRERLIARIPTIFATHHACRSGAALPVPHAGFGHSKNLLAMLGLAHDDLRVRLTDVGLVTQAEQGTGASAFAARVAVNAGADIFAAITAAIGTFDGPGQGGAIAETAAMLKQIGSPDRAKEYVRKHRKMAGEDPRAQHLRAAAEELAAITRRGTTLEILEALHMLGADAGLRGWTVAFYEQLGIPEDLYLPMSAASRVTGWLAHIDEEAGGRT